MDLKLHLNDQILLSQIRSLFDNAILYTGIAARHLCDQPGATFFLVDLPVVGKQQIGALPPPTGVGKLHFSNCDHDSTFLNYKLCADLVHLKTCDLNFELVYVKCELSQLNHHRTRT